MTKKIKKGFTLTELIVVIAIIAILAAVLIPTSISFINKAKESADLQELTNMNKILSLNAITDDVSYYNADDVEYLLCEQNEFTLNAKSKGKSFWYNRATNCIELLSDDDLGLEVYAEESTDIYTKQVEQVHPSQPEYLYVDKADNKLRQAIDTIKDLVSLGDKNINNMNTIFEVKVSSLTPGIVKDHLLSYDPDNTLYIDETGYYTSAPISSGILSVQNVVFTSRTINLPKCENSDDESITVTSEFRNIEVLEGVIELPKRLISIADGALTKLSSSVSIGVTDSNRNLINKNNINENCNIIETSNNKKVYVIGVYYYDKVDLVNSTNYSDYYIINGDNYEQATYYSENTKYYTKYQYETYSWKQVTEVTNQNYINYYVLEDESYETPDIFNSEVSYYTFIKEQNDGYKEVEKASNITNYSDYYTKTNDKYVTSSNSANEYYKQYKCPQDEIIYIKDGTQFFIDNTVLKDYYEEGISYDIEVKSFFDNVNIFEVIITRKDGPQSGSVFARGIVRYISVK